jgi:hypothetical protein
MELIIVLAIVGMIIAYLVMQRRKETTVAEQPAVGQPYLDPVAPYKVETPPAPAVEAVAEVTPAPAAQPVAEVAAPAVVEELVIEKPAAKPKRAKVDGKFVKDNSATPENEAWEGGIAPVKKPRKPRSKKV